MAWTAPATTCSRPTSTAGGVLSIGAATDRRFRAFESRTGRELWSFETPELIRGNPITCLGKDGRQYVTVVAGTTALAFRLPCLKVLNGATKALRT